MKHEGINWHKQYLQVGQYAAVYPLHWQGKPYVGVVQKITKNKYKRISYIINGKKVEAEYLFPARNQEKLKLKKFWSEERFSE